MDSVIKLLKEKGQRLTVQKKEVYCILKNKPQTVTEIYLRLCKNKKQLDQSTVYRILAGFVELGVVREVQLGDKELRYELVGAEHHHHLVCEKCGGIEDVELAEDTLIKEVKKQSKFQVKRHSLEFFGTCRECQ